MSSMRVASRTGLVVLLASLVLPACAGMAGSAPHSRVLTTKQFPDIPVPRGFGLDSTTVDTFTYSEGGNHRTALRMGRLNYEGSTPVEAVVAYYETEMPRPMHGWSAGEVLPASDDGASRLLFVRGEDRCVVRVHASGGMTHLMIERNTGEATSATD
ncbi:MAG: hypothetical protein ACYTDX_00350 [Planctomycetota bacterium]|jgi:hypothetical protein